MRGFRSTLILLVVFLGMLGYIYFYLMKRPATPETEAKTKVFDVKPETIDEIRIRTAAGDVTAKKASGSWELVEPAAKADETELSSITTNLSSLEIQRVVDEQPSDLKQYGLAEPRVDVGFKASGDKELKHLIIGDKTATGNDLYAKLPADKKVFLISGFLDTTFNKTPFDLRDKTILKFERDKVDMVSIVMPAQTIELAKMGTDWRLKKPVDARADFSAVEGAIGRLQSGQMKSIAAADAKDLKQYGLDAPAVTATVGAGSVRATLAIGKAAEGGNLYARDTSRPTIFTVEASLADDLKKATDTYRRKDLFEARAFNTDRVELTRGGATIAIEKVKGDGKDAKEKWRQIAPAAADLDTTKVEAWLSKLTELNAQSFAEPKTDTGLSKPIATVVIKFSDAKKEERVTFGRAGAEAYASRVDEAGAAKIDAMQLDEALKGVDSLK
jgi:hypothetical protein